MFFGNMQPFYRRNSIHSQASSQSSKPHKELIQRTKHSARYKNDDDNDIRTKNGIRSSFSMPQKGDYEEPVIDYKRTNVPDIKIGLYEPETREKSFNILKEKEKALWYNNCPILDDNAERLGPNKNNIIGDTLEIERRKSGDWGH